MARLYEDRDGTAYYTEARVETEPGKLQGLLNDTRWKILSALAERPRYPAALARDLDMHEQKVYYHVRKLEADGLITVVDRQERGGTVAKTYRATADAFALKLPTAQEHVADRGLPDVPSQVTRFLDPFLDGGSLAADIVVGSPDPHGPHQVRARDAHLAADVGLFLGQFGRADRPRTRLDVDVMAADAVAGNKVLVGGPLTNMVTREVNDRLPVRFKVDNFPFREIVSEQSGETYTEDSIGFLATLPNPTSPEDRILVVAGVRMKGTVAATLALTQEADTVLADYEGEDKWAAVVRGKDMDGDGTVDAVDALEP